MSALPMRRTADRKFEYEIEPGRWVSRQRVHQLRNPLRTHARRIVSEALESGALRRGKCEVCGHWAEAHHDDYALPLVVRWLCPEHHAALHATERAASMRRRALAAAQHPRRFVKVHSYVEAESMKRTTPTSAIRELVASLGSQLAVARLLGVSPAYVNDILQGRRAAGPKVLKKLKLRRVTRYEECS